MSYYTDTVKKEYKILRNDLRDSNVSIEEVSEWLHCTPQNVYKHFRDTTFSWEQVIVIREHLKIKEG